MADHFTLTCHDADGRPVPIAEVVRAVAAGDADPDRYRVALQPTDGPADDRA